MISDGSATASLANEAKSVLDLCINTPADCADAVSSWTELVLLELAMSPKKNQYCGENVQFATFDLIADAIKSYNLSVAQHCCSSLATFFQKSENATESQPEKLSDLNAEKSDSVAFQCDGCSIFPIQFKRYTLEGHDIDLCKKCFESCCEYASTHQNNPDQVVVIGGKTLSLGGDEKMTCSQIWGMRPMSIASSIVEQVEQVRRAAEADPSVSSFDDRAFGDDDDAALQLALKMSLESQHEVNHLEEETAMSLYESDDFISDVFSDLLNLAIDSLLVQSEGIFLHHPAPLFQLVLRLIQSSESEELRLQKGQRMAEALCDRIILLVKTCIEKDPSKDATAQAKSSLIIAIRSLVSLIVQKFSLDGFDSTSIPEQEEPNDSETFSLSPSSMKKRDKTDPRFVCEVHGVPAVRRRCSHGAHKDRRFYVCGLERKQRCRYFKWADPDGDEKPSKSPMQLQSQSGSFSPEPSPTTVPSSDSMKEQDAFNQYLWKLLSKPMNSAETNKESSKSDTTRVSRTPTDPGQTMNIANFTTHSAKVPSLQSELCKLLEMCFRSSESTSTTDCPTSRLTRDSDISNEKPLMPSLHSERSSKDELIDGVLRSREKLGPPCANKGRQTGEKAAAVSESKLLTSIPNDELVVVQACLDLLSMVATNSLKKPPASSSTEMSNWSTDWFSLLCEIISTNSPNKANLRNTAKKMLKRLCGGRRAVYHRVRDHYIFRIQFWNLLHHCEEPLTTALLVREKARLSGPNWQGREYDWSNLPAGGLIGVGDLIPEDNLAVENDEKIRQVLDELIDVTKSRGGNWRQFCGLTELPRPSYGKKGFELALKAGKITDAHIHSRAPICSMLWIACSISGSNQIKALRMIDVALSNEDKKEMLSMERKAWPNAADEILSTDVGTDLEFNFCKNIEQLQPSKVVREEPNSAEHALLRITGGLSIDDVHAFVVHFVLRGRTAELRSIASKTTQKLLHNISPEGHEILFQKLIGGQALGEVGGLGCAATEFLEFLQSFVGTYGSNVRNQIPDASRIVVDCFVRQLRAMRKDLCGGVGDEASIMKIESEPGKTMRKRFNLSNCVHCHRKRSGFPERSDEKSSCLGAGARSSCSSPKDLVVGNDSLLSGRSANPGGRSSASSKTSPSTKLHSEVPWLLDQVRPYSRSALEASTANVVSTEFASHLQLKLRMAISQIHLSVTDPRGRLVKKIGVFFSPRQVSDVQELKAEEYNEIWQRCGTMSLARGAAQASCKLVTPVIAANLKFEFMEFYEKVGGSRSADGGLLLHCPRCTRVVNNAHGVCGNCGEVAFQCRKCRHINYDRLDAFLCIECGYCASGSFSFEVTAGVALNSIAIIDEEGVERAVSLLRIAHRRLAEARSNLKKKLLLGVSLRRKRSHNGDMEDLDELNKYGPAMKRAMLGELPKSGVKEHSDNSGGGESSSKRSNSLPFFSTSRGSSSRLSVANKARSLLSLARQLRSESSGSGADNERSSRGDMLVRQALLNAGSGGSIEFFDDSTDGDMFGIVNTSGMPDPLSRLVANIQARVRNTSSGSGNGNDVGGAGGRLGSSGGGDGDGTGGGSQQNDQSPKAQMEECDRLYRQKLEAERECYELQRRIDAWNRLDSDVLADYGPTTPLSLTSPVYLPTSCSVCSGSITYHLLVLAMAIFRGGFDRAECALSRDFVAALFDESQNMSAKLSELKRLAIITLTMKSRNGARLVFDELKTRLMATRDVVSAEILGHLIEHEFDGSDVFVQLAMEVLDAGM
uniref:GRF-type domain-containing protein n=1 Tax=Ditylum brightwellii TaxID=49249 RepID=A0A7S2EA45_9STRA